MSIESDLQTALAAITGLTGGCHQDDFPQEPKIPVMPAIRFTVVSLVPGVDICGDDAEATGDRRVQVDIVARSIAERRAIRAQLLTVMATFDPPAILDNERREKDPDTKAFRSSIDYLIYPSTDEDSP